VRLRLHGPPAECETAARRLAEVFDVVAVSGPYPDRGPGRLVRVDLELRLDPVPPSPPAGPDRTGRQRGEVPR
jgi:hypothetical protein